MEVADTGRHVREDINVELAADASGQDEVCSCGVALAVGETGTCGMDKSPDGHGTRPDKSRVGRNVNRIDPEARARPDRCAIVDHSPGDRGNLTGEG